MPCGSNSLYGAGETASLLRRTDWSASPLGASGSWPVSLRSIVAFALNSPLAVAVVWGDDLTTIYNDAYSRILGDKHPRVFGQAFSALWPDFWEQAQPLVAKAYAGEASFFEDVPYTIQRQARTHEAWITFSCSPVFGEDGAIQGMVAVCIDTTEKVLLEQAQREAQAELRKMQNWLQQGLDNGRMVVWEWDLKTNQIKYSHNATDILGYAFSEVEHSWARVHPEDVNHLRAVVNRAIEELGAFHETSRRVDGATGRIAWVEQRGRVVPDGHGKPVSILGVNIDVTDRVMAELELRDANQRKDEFLAMLAHELRNPIAPISTAAYLLKIAGHDENRVKQTSDIIGRQVRHMTELLDDLLDVSRVTRGLVAIQEDKVDIRAVIANAIEQAHPLIEAKNHVLHTRAAYTPAFVKGDQTRLVQVVANLLNNACKYTPPGGEITLELHVLEAEIKLVVADNGIGIEADLLPRVFDLFTQAKRSPDRAQSGLGLGLALVQALVGLHGGRVEAKSEGAGKGSAFSVYLPSMTSTDTDRGHGEEIPASPVVSQPLTLAIVDDNADAADLLATVLRTFGHDVMVRHDAAGLLADERLAGIKVFVLDIGLPGVDGYELASQLRAHPETAHAMLIALTGYGQEKDVEMAMAAGFDHHLVKPVHLERLQELLAALT